jgi:hypothetical protein
MQIGSLAWIYHDEGFKIQDALELTQGDVEQIADAARESFKEPDVRTGAGELDMAETLAANTRECNFDAALVANDAAVLHALILAAQALPIGDGAEDAGTEESVALRLKGSVVDGFGLGYFTMRPASDFFRRRETDSYGIEVRD